GDFSDLLPGTQITDPDTGLAVPGNIFTPDQWATKFNPVAKNFLDVLPRTDDPTGLVSLSGAVRVRDYHEFTIKPDWYLSPKHHISGGILRQLYSPEGRRRREYLVDGPLLDSPLSKLRWKLALHDPT